MWKVYSLINPGKLRASSEHGIFIAPARQDAIENKYTVHQHRAYAYASYAVKCHTKGCWLFLAAGLYNATEIDALENALTFLNRRG